MSAIKDAQSRLTTLEALASLPVILDMSADTITDNVISINSTTPNARVKFVFERLVTHLHDFAREVRLSTDEWMAALNFLVDVGKMCSDVRHEFILLSDILGLSLLVDSINHPKSQGATEGTVLGPFHTHDAPDIEHGTDISSDPSGEPLLAICSIKDTEGKPIEGVKVDIWETDSSGRYDTQYSNRSHADGRCCLQSDAEGNFWFKAIKPVEYPIPNDGPTGKLLALLNRHPFRPAHMHFMFTKPGWDKLITALYVKGDPFVTSDAVFGVKNSLVTKLTKLESPDAEKYQIAPGSWLLKHDFVLMSESEASTLREQRSLAAMKTLGAGKVVFVDGLPVPEVD